MRLVFTAVCTAAGAAIFTAASPSPAKATFGCEIGHTQKGYANLYSKPDTQSKVIRRVRAGQMVSLLDSEMMLEHKSLWDEGKWRLVTHLAKGDPRWGVGLRGWVLKQDIAPNSCG